MSAHLVLFFTRGVSLRTWSMVGMLEREIAVYKLLLSSGHRVSFVTYGDRSDLVYADLLGEIGIYCNQDGLAPEEYEVKLFELHKDILGGCDVIKTNQMYGADIALAAARLYHKPLVARCGYLWSLNAAREHGHDSPRAQEARRVEAEAFSAADRIVVTTEAMATDVRRRLPDVTERIRIIPNYVDTDAFCPGGVSPDSKRLLFVGRIAPEKNLDSLLKAVEPLDVELVLIGEGKLRPELQKRFAHLDGRVIWEGNVPNSRLPEYLNGSAMFVLPSLYEGHPKALIEAMSCGMPVVGADSPGIREVIDHGHNGYLCGSDPESIREAVVHLLSRPDICSELGGRAREFVLSRYSLHTILGMEAAVMAEATDPKDRK